MYMNMYMYITQGKGELIQYDRISSGKIVILTSKPPTARVWKISWGDQGCWHASGFDQVAREARGAGIVSGNLGDIFRMADDMDSYDSFPINWIFETRHHLRGNASNPATSQWHNTKAGSTDKRHRNVMKLWSNRNEKTLTRRKSELGFINHKISKVKPMGWTSLLLIQLATLSEKAPGQWRQYKGAA